MIIDEEGVNGGGGSPQLLSFLDARCRDLVTLSRFDLAGSALTDRIASDVRLVDGDGDLLLDLGTSITINGAGPSRSTFLPDFTHDGTVRIPWAADWNIGIDTITF